jgi:hypothetical protein
MEEYVNTFYHKSSHLITESDRRRLSALFVHDMGIDNFRISPDGVYLEYNSYIYSPDQLEKILLKNGFTEAKEPKHGFLSKHIRHLADSNNKTFGNRNPDCCG